MPASKIQDEQEVIRWFEEGKTYEEMSRIYREKYDIETVPSMWSNFRRRRGLSRRIVRDDTLIPWAVQPQHRFAYPLTMLRHEARQRAGEPVREADAGRHAAFIRKLRTEGLVVDYDPSALTGFAAFSLVPRKPGEDLVRQPKVAAARTSRHAAD